MVVVLGIAMVIHALTPSLKMNGEIPVLLAISVAYNDNSTVTWCKDLSAMVAK